MKDLNPIPMNPTESNPFVDLENAHKPSTDPLVKGSSPFKNV